MSSEFDKIARGYQDAQSRMMRGGRRRPSKSDIQRDLVAQARAEGLDVTTLIFLVRLYFWVRSIWRSLR